MIVQRMHWLADGLFTAVLAGLLLAQPAVRAQDTPGPDQIPGKVMDALKSRFPAVEIHKWTREKEDDIVIYDIEFTQESRKFEADIREDGTIDNWEKEITAQDLPGAVRKTVDQKYPRSTITEIMEITVVREGQEALEGYEVVLKTAGRRDVEVTVAPDGTILEESGDEE